MPSYRLYKILAIKIVFLILCIDAKAKIQETSQIQDSLGIANVLETAEQALFTSPNSAIAHAKKGLRLSEKSQNSECIAQSLRILAEAYRKMNQLELAGKYFALYTSRKDSIRQQSSSNTIAKLIAKNQSEKRQQKLSQEQELKHSILRSQIQDEQIARTNLGIIIVLIIGLILLTSWFLIVSRNKNQQLTKLQQELKLTTEKQKVTIAEIASQVLQSNKDISRYSFLNSHRLRAPLARIMSAVYLLEKVDFERDSLQRELKTSASKLEEAVKEIIAEQPTSVNTASKS